MVQYNGMPQLAINRDRTCCRAYDNMGQTIFFLLGRKGSSIVDEPTQGSAENREVSAWRQTLYFSKTISGRRYTTVCSNLGKEVREER